MILPSVRELKSDMIHLAAIVALMDHADNKRRHQAEVPARIGKAVGWRLVRFISSA